MEWHKNTPQEMLVCELCGGRIESPAAYDRNPYRQYVGHHKECSGQGMRCTFHDSVGRRCTLERATHAIGDDGRRHQWRNEQVTDGEALGAAVTAIAEAVFGTKQGGQCDL